MIINVVLISYRNLNEELVIDMYINGKTSNIQYLKDIALELFYDGVFNDVKKYHYIYGQIQTVRQNHISIQNKVNKVASIIKLKVSEHKSESLKHEPIKELITNRRMINFIKKLCLREINDSDYDEDLIHFNPEDSEKIEFDDVILNNLMSKDQNKIINNTRDNIKEQNVTFKDLFDTNDINVILNAPLNQQKIIQEFTRKDIIIDGEMERNLKMLKSINFITNDYYIYNDKVILKKPCANAWGDWIKHRDKSYYYNNSREFCISRIGWNQIWDDFSIS